MEFLLDCHIFLQDQEKTVNYAVFLNSYVIQIQFINCLVFFRPSTAEVTGHKSQFTYHYGVLTPWSTTWLAKCIRYLGPQHG